MLNHRTLGPGALVVGAALVLSSCGLFGGSDGSDATRSSTVPRSTSTTSTTIAAPSTDLLSPGTAPRRVLRLELTPGVTTVAMTTDIDLTQRAAGTTTKVPSPAVRQVVAFRVGTFTDGVADVSFAIRSSAVVRANTDLTDAEVTSIDEAYATLAGIGGTGRIDTQGHLTGFRYQIPPGASPTVRTYLTTVQDQFQDLSVPLPTEAVGVGARWRSTRTLVSSGVNVTQETTYTLTSLSDTEMGYTSVVTQTAQDQDMTLAGLPTGTTAHLVSARGTGQAAGSTPFTSMAVTAHASNKVTQVLDLTTGATTQRLTQAVGVTLDIAPAP